MLDRLRRCAREAREAAGLSQLDIAVAAHVSPATISNFETGRKRTRDLERIVAVYEAECGLLGGELWRRAGAP